MKDKTLNIKNRQLRSFKANSTLGKIFTFIYKGLFITVLPPLHIRGRYDYTESIYINGKLIREWSEDSDVMKVWRQDFNELSDKDRMFKIDFFIFTNTIFRSGDFSDQFSNSLKNHLLTIENSFKYLDFYVLTYVDKEFNTANTVVKEFNKQRVSIIIEEKYKLFKSEILSIRKWKKDEHEKFTCQVPV